MENNYVLGRKVDLVSISNGMLSTFWNRRCTDENNEMIAMKMFTCGWLVSFLFSMKKWLWALYSSWALKNECEERQRGLFARFKIFEFWIMLATSKCSKIHLYLKNSPNWPFSFVIFFKFKSLIKFKNLPQLQVNNNNQICLMWFP